MLSGFSPRQSLHLETRLHVLLLPSTSQLNHIGTMPTPVLIWEGEQHLCHCPHFPLLAKPTERLPAIAQQISF